jgi:hypothetical protein
LLLNFISLIFQWKEKVIVDDDFNHQNDLFLYQMVLYDEGGFKIMYFFTLKTTRKIDLSPARFFVSG